MHIPNPCPHLRHLGPSCRQPVSLVNNPPVTSRINRCPFRVRALISHRRADLASLSVKSFKPILFWKLLVTRRRSETTIRVGLENSSGSASRRMVASQAPILTGIFWRRAELSSGARLRGVFMCFISYWKEGARSKVWQNSIPSNV